VEAVEQEPNEQTRSVEFDAVLEVRDAAKREIDVRLLPWDTTIDTVVGPEEFRRGAFADTPQDGLYLMEPEHAGVQIAIGQDGNATPRRVPVGRSIAVREEDDGAHATFRVARTAKGDESLALAADRILTGVSVEFQEVAGGTTFVVKNGRRVRQHNRVSARGAVLTHRPAYGEQAAVLAVRSQEVPPVTEQIEAAPETRSAAIVQTSVPMVTVDMFREGMHTLAEQFNKPMADLVARLGQMQEQTRADFSIPGIASDKPAPKSGEWFKLAVRLMTGDRVSDLETRELADIITTDNIGVVPPNYSSEIVGFIDPARPFLQTTRRIDEGDSGMGLILPRIVTRPTVDVQSTQKTEVDSTATAIDTVTFNPTTIAGAGDISIQLLKRSSPSFLSLYLELLAEAYAIKSDDLAVDALLAQAAVVEGGELDPNDAELGAAWSNGMAVSSRLTPDHIWLSSAAVAAFIDAKASGTNAPLYSNIEANFTAGGGTGGTISGLRPVHVPALDDEDVDIIVGPSRGFLWAEDGTYTLQVDVPAKAGKDVAIVGMIWYAPVYPAAFTTFTLAGS
jgi:hypothetical protein